MSKRHERKKAARLAAGGKPRWRVEGRQLQRDLDAAKNEAAELRVSLAARDRDLLRDQQLFEALRRDTGIEARTGEELIAGVVNQITTLRESLANVQKAVA